MQGREERERRLLRRRTISGLLSGLVAVSVFAAGAVWQWRRPVVGERNAQMQARISNLKSLQNLELQLHAIALAKELLSFSPDGNLIATASDDKKVYLWKPSGRHIETLIGHEEPVNHISFSPDGKLLASASDDKNMRLWKADGTPVATLFGHQGSVNHLSFSPDAKLLASASSDGTIRLWNLDLDS